MGELCQALIQIVFTIDSLIIATGGTTVATFFRSSNMTGCKSISKGVSRC